MQLSPIELRVSFLWLMVLMSPTFQLLAIRVYRMAGFQWCSTRAILLGEWVLGQSSLPSRFTRRRGSWQMLMFWLTLMIWSHFSDLLLFSFPLESLLAVLRYRYTLAGLLCDRVTCSVLVRLLPPTLRLWAVGISSSSWLSYLSLCFSVATLLSLCLALFKLSLMSLMFLSGLTPYFLLADLNLSQLLVCTDFTLLLL